MKNTIDEFGNETNSQIERLRKKQRDEQFRQESLKFYNRHNQLKKPNGS